MLSQNYNNKAKQFINQVNFFHLNCKIQEISDNKDFYKLLVMVFSGKKYIVSISQRNRI